MTLWLNMGANNNAFIIYFGVFYCNSFVDFTLFLFLGQWVRPWRVRQCGKEQVAGDREDYNPAEYAWDN